MATETIAPIPRRRRRPLANVRDCARELARLYYELREGSIDPAIAGRAAFILQGLGRMIEVSEIERKLEAIEHDTESSEGSTTQDRASNNRRCKAGSN